MKTLYGNTDSRDTILCHNKEILEQRDIGAKPFFFHEWFTKGVKTIWTFWMGMEIFFHSMNLNLSILWKRTFFNTIKLSALFQTIFYKKLEN